MLFSPNKIFAKYILKLDIPKFVLKPPSCPGDSQNMEKIKGHDTALL